MPFDFNDAQQALAFLTPQQLRIEAQVYQQRYPSFDYSQLMPVNTEGDMWDAGSVFYSGDIAGAAAFMSARGFDMPYADISTDQFVRENHMAAIGYEWSRGELERAARLGRNLTAEKATAANRVAEQFCYKVATVGSAEKGWTGLFNNTSVTAVAVGAAWTAATAPETILADVNGALSAPFNATGEAFDADTLILPSTAMQLLAGKIITGTNVTLLSFIQQNNAVNARGGNLTIRGSRDLETAGAGGTRRMVAYQRDPQVAQFHLPGPHEFLDPFRKSSLTYEVAGIMNVGGTEIRIPKAVAYRDAF